MRWSCLNKSGVWAYVVNNIICVICFSALAILFDKWWVALFAFLFFATPYPKSVMKYYRICDGCGRHSPYADSYNDALEKAKANGWVHYVDGDKDYCPSCQMEF